MQEHPYRNDEPPVKSNVEGRLLLELREGQLTLYPITDTDEQTRELLLAVFNHIKRAIGRERSK